MRPIPTLPPRRDIVASLGVFTIAVPLSLGIALASGVPASAAIVAAIIGGLVVGMLTGAPLVVSGPAAGLAALTLQYVQQYGLRGLAIITIIAGIIQIALGAARLGRLFTLVPKPVLQGMLAAIGAIIAMNQLHVLLGGSVPPTFRIAVTSLLSKIHAALTDPLLQVVTVLGVSALVIQLIWPKISGRLSWIPGALPAVIAVTLIALNWDVPRVELESLVDATIIAVTSWSKDPPSIKSIGALLVPAGGLALVASAETLLTARAVDTLAAAHKINSKSNLDRELIAQGVGNALAGAVGGMPLTGVIVRSAANVGFGATSRWSTILHGVWIAAAVILLPIIVTSIPLTALAAVLVITGFKLLNPQLVVASFKERPADGALWAVTFGAILATDLLRGLTIALATAWALHLWNHFRSGGMFKQNKDATTIS